MNNLHDFHMLHQHLHGIGWSGVMAWSSEGIFDGTRPWGFVQLIPIGMKAVKKEVNIDA